MVEIAVHALTLLALFLGSAFFSGTETALFSLSKIERRRLSESHPRLAQCVMDHLDHPRIALMTLIIGNLFVSTWAASLTTLIAIKVWGSSHLGLVMTVYAVAFILISEIVPKIIAVRMNEGFALAAACPLKIFNVMFYPMRLVTRFITDRVISVLVAGKKEHSDLISEEELKMLVKIGEEEGVLDRQERQMIHKLFELGERPVREIMTPRVDMAALDIEDSRDKHVTIMKNRHYSHFPVYQGLPDQILGVVLAQDYLLSSEKNPKPFLRSPLFVPETKRIDDLLEEFRRKRESFAVCVDEYGGTSGIVTLEDILEEIFGEYYDEYAAVENPIRPFGHQEYWVEGKIAMDNFNEFFSTDLRVKEAATLAGFIMEQLGEVPQPGRVLVVEGLEFRVHQMVRNRILSVVVRRKP